MEKEINIKIIGTLTPEVGVAEQYTVKKENEPFEIEPITLGSDWSDAEIEWFVHVRDAGKWRFIDDGKKIGKTVDFTFSEISQDWEEIVIIVHAYGGKDIINISPQPAAKPKITFIELLDVHKNTPKKAFAYGNWIIARVHCVGMELRPIVVTLWEDDGNGKKNTKIELKNRFIERGFVDARFYLNPAHADLANSKSDKGESDEGQFHEYYITASIAGEKKSQISTENTTVANPLYLEKKLAVKNEISTDIQQQVINSLMMVDVSGDDPDGVWTKKEDTCVCKEYDLIWGNKVSCAFRKKVIKICKDLWKEDYLEMANNLMAIMAWETGETFSPSIKNPNSSATGLVQFIESTARSLGTTTHELANMIDLKQLYYVKKYFSELKNKKIEFVDLYLHVIFPASVGKDDDHVVFSEKGEGLDKSDKNYDLRIAAYKINKGFDTNSKYGNNNGMVTKGEIKKSIQIYIDKGKENKAGTFLCVAEKYSNLWHHPVKNPQLRGWYSVWAPERSIHSANVLGRSKGKHDGLDFYAPLGTTVYACITGEVSEVYYSSTYGNCINIKGEYDGENYWFFYAHLSETFIKAKDINGNPTKIKLGEEIGKSGKTGSSATDLRPNQVHLHFEVRITDARTGGRVDPFEKIIELENDVITEPKEEDQL